MKDRHSCVGIIANPASGKDIRRLVAYGSVFDNNEKVNILRRVLLALEAIGVRRVIFMPDYCGLGWRALDGLRLSLEVDFLDMPVQANEQDSIEAARRFREIGVDCIVTLGGDGTNRAVAKGCGDIPLVPISTGTNNVFPYMVEGTIAGLAAGLIAVGAVDPKAVTFPTKRLELYLVLDEQASPAEDDLVDIALIDVAICTDLFIGSRALWDPKHIRSVILARAQAGSIGLSALGSCLHPFDAQDPFGMYVELGEGGRSILAPIAPGLILPVPVRQYQLLAVGDELLLNSGPCTVALDGERSIEISGDLHVHVRLTHRGPRVVDIRKCLAEAARAGTFRLEST